MTQIIEQLGPELKKAFKRAEEIWIAVALMNEAGLDFIEESIPKILKANYVFASTVQKCYVKNSV